MNYTIVGIDFGTSTTVVKIKNYGEGTNPRDYLPLTFNGSSYLPTKIFEDEGGQLYFGYDAETKMDNGAKGIPYENFKMDLISSDQQTKAKQQIKEFFKYIYMEFNQNRSLLNVYPTVKTYISYPAKWTAETRSWMKQCAIEAGFGTENNVFGESEPTAAIYASLVFNLEYMQQEHIVVRNQPINVMMLDMGAGTSDIAIFKFKIDDNNKPVIDELITYPTVDNVHLCGGREIDNILADYLIEYIKKVSPNNQINDEIIKTIKYGIKKWKDTSLSQALTDYKTIGLPSQIVPQLNLLRQLGALNDIPFDDIDRQQFESLTQSHWKQLRSLIEDSIKEAKNRLSNFNSAEDIDLVILTGGHSLWYGVSEFILGKSFADLEPLNFSKIKQQPLRLLQETHPQETVANGLVFKDVQFDIKHTMGNSLWIQYEINDQKSELFEIAPLNDVLPIPNENNKGVFNWEVSIIGHSLTAKKVRIICYCYSGSTITNAVCKKSEQTVPLNNFFFAAIGAPFRTTFALLGEAWNFATLQWDKLGKSTKKCFEEKYTVKISSSVKIAEDGTGNIDAKIGLDWNNADPFYFKL